MKKSASKEAAIGETTRPLNILLVEDSEDIQYLIKLYLEKLPCRVDIANNGEIGVENFISNNYDLVLMDMKMPVMDGYAATKAIKEWLSENSKKDVPVIAFTAHAFKNEIDRCIDVGCAAYLGKPVRKAQLLEVIYKFANNVNKVNSGRMQPTDSSSGLPMETIP
ncbi:MAG: response regulator [bacterium]|nr:response regulator [bacterium]